MHGPVYIYIYILYTYIPIYIHINICWYLRSCRISVISSHGKADVLPWEGSSLSVDDLTWLCKYGPPCSPKGPCTCISDAWVLQELLYHDFVACMYYTCTWAVFLVWFVRESLEDILVQRLVSKAKGPNPSYNPVKPSSRPAGGSNKQSRHL